MAGLIVVLIGIAYANSFFGVLVYDDRVTITENPTIRSFWPPETVLNAPPQAGTAGRPLANLSFAVSYALSGMQPWGHHLVNVVVHALAALALFGFIRRTLLRPSLREKFGAEATPLAGTIALLWAVHPMQTQTVTYISQRTESLMALWYVVTLYCFARATEHVERIADSENNRQPATTRWLGLAVTACLLGVLSKEVIATVPLLVLLYDRTFVAGTFRGALRARRWFYAALAATWLPLAWLLIGVHVRGVGYGLGIPWFDYALTQCKAVVTYLGLGLWPSPLIFDRGMELLHSVPEALPYALVLIALLGATGWALVARPAVGFLGAWFFVILTPASSVIPVVRQPIAENRPYLPLAALVALLLLGLHSVLPRRWTMIAGVALGLASIVATVERNRVYHSVYEVWADAAAKVPDNPRPYHDMGIALEQAGRNGEAMFAYRLALQLDPYHTDARNNFANHLAQSGHLEMAAIQYETVIQLQDDHATARKNLGLILMELGQAAKALPHLERAVRTAPNSEAVNSSLGEALVTVGQAERALGYIRRALKINPNRATTYNLMGLALAQLKRLPEAREQFERAVQLDPKLPEAHNNLGDLSLQAGREQEAIAHFQRALALKPGLVDAHQNLGSAYARLSQLPEATKEFAEVVRLDPQHAQAHNNLGAMLVRQGRLAEGVKEFEIAVRLKPEDIEAKENLSLVRKLLEAPKR